MKTCKMHLWQNKRKFKNVGDRNWGIVETNNPECQICKEKLNKGFIFKKRLLREEGNFNVFTYDLIKNNI